MQEIATVKPTRNQGATTEMWLHVILAFICLMGYYRLGEFFKILVVPYIMYMVFSLRPVYIPALIVHFIPGSTVSFVILVSSLFLGMLHLKKLSKYNLRWLFLILLLPFPVILYQSYQRYAELGYGLILILTHWDLYLGFFPLFYGVLIAPKIKRIHLRSLFYLLILLFVMDLFRLFGTNLRYTFYIFPLVFGLIMAFYTRKEKVKEGFLKVLVTLIFLVLLIKLPSATFTIMMTSVVTLLIVYIYNKRLLRLLSFFRSYAFVVSTLLFVVYAVYNFDKFEVNKSVAKRIGQGSFSISNFSELKDKILYKAFADRAPIWKAVLEENVLSGNIWPPLMNESYLVVLANGAHWEAEIPAHNIFLELFRSNGILLGALLSIVLVLIFLMVGNSLRLGKLDNYRIAMVASVVSCAFLGGMTGQYLLLNTFSFLFMTIAGLCLAYPVLVKEQYVGKN